MKLTRYYVRAIDMDPDKLRAAIVDNHLEFWRFDSDDNAWYRTAKAAPGQRAFPDIHGGPEIHAGNAVDAIEQRLADLEAEQARQISEIEDQMARNFEDFEMRFEQLRADHWRRESEWAPGD